MLQFGLDNLFSFVNGLTASLDFGSIIGSILGGFGS